MKTETTHLKGQEVGRLITEELSEYLKKYTGNHERAQASENSGVGVSTIVSLATRRNTLTENNYPGLVELVKIAVAKCKEERGHAETAVDHMESLIQ